MSRIRTVKPEFWTSEQILSCSLPARLLFIGLWNFADDHGVHPASIVRLKAEILPDDSCSQDDVKGWVAELINKSLLQEYSVDNQSYWIVPSWKKHQRIDKPTYKHPLPSAPSLSKKEDELNQNLTTSPRIIDDYSTSPIRVLDESSITEWIGMEGIGKEEKISEAEASPIPVSNKKLTASSEVEAVFSHWQEVMGHLQAKLDKKRQSKIEAALRLGFTIEQLKQAIDGCARSPFNMGLNDRSQKYNSVDLIFRDAEHIERFIAATENAIPSSGIDRNNPIFAGVI